MNSNLLVNAICDLKWARLQLESGDEADFRKCAFNIQQCVEKSLKELLAFYGVEPKRTHDIGVLLSQFPTSCAFLDDELFVSLYNFSSALTDWEAKSRYDGNYLVGKRFLERGIVIAGAVLDFVNSVVNGQTAMKECPYIVSDVNKLNLED